MSLTSEHMRHSDLAGVYGLLAVKEAMRGRSWWRETALQAAYHDHLARELLDTAGIALEARKECRAERGQIA